MAQTRLPVTESRRYWLASGSRLRLLLAHLIGMASYACNLQLRNRHRIQERKKNKKSKIQPKQTKNSKWLTQQNEDEKGQCNASVQGYFQCWCCTGRADSSKIEPPLIMEMVADVFSEADANHIYKAKLTSQARCRSVFCGNIGFTRKEETRIGAIPIRRWVIALNSLGCILSAAFRITNSANSNQLIGLWMS